MYIIIFLNNIFYINFYLISLVKNNPIKSL